ncbi:putative sugar phosphate isomerase YwlF [compost metagenome]
MGVSLVANKQKGIYAAVVESEFTAAQSKIINNANVIALGSLVQSDHMAKRIIEVFLTTPFDFNNQGPAEAYSKMKGIEDSNFK